MGLYQATAFLLIGIALAFLWQTVIVKNYQSTPEEAQTDAKSTTELLIGVISARNNFELRNAVRKSWVHAAANYSSLQTRISVKFVIGSKPCRIPVEDRIDPFGCQRDVFIEFSQENIFAVTSLQENVQGNWIHAGPVGFDFEVLHPIVLTQMGIFDSGADGFETLLKVHLYDYTSQTLVATSSFFKASSGLCTQGFCYEDINHMVLPKGFKGCIVAEHFNSIDPMFYDTGNCQMHDGQGLIQFKMRWRSGQLPGTFPNVVNTYSDGCPFLAASFAYHFYGDLKDPSMEATAKLERYENYQLVVLEENGRIAEESSLHSDIVLVDAVDTYRNIPLKVLHFFSWAMNNMEFVALLKTDDDTFLRLPEIVNSRHFARIKHGSSVWWGNFRKNWQVNRHGKWEDDSYEAVAYPPFACGSGSVLSKSLVSLIASNKDKLQLYQGEDVTIGIWMSAFHHIRIEDRNWCCSKLDCHAAALSLPDNNPSELIELQRLMDQGLDPCLVLQDKTESSG